MRLSELHQSASGILDEQITSLEEAIRKKETSLKRQREREVGNQTTSTEEPKGASNADWRDAYSAWDGYEDADELERQIDAAKAKAESLRARRDRPNPFAPSSSSCCASHNRCAERKVALLSTDERLDCMKRFCKEGNDLFSSGSYEQALVLYEKSLIYYEYCVDATVDEQAEVDRQRLRCLLNAAACFLKLGRYGPCIDYCTQALRIDGGSVKARYRRAKAYRHLGKVEEAKSDLIVAAGLSRGGKVDPALMSEQRALDVVVQKDRETSREMSQKMWKARRR